MRARIHLWGINVFPEPEFKHYEGPDAFAMVGFAGFMFVQSGFDCIPFEHSPVEKSG